MNRRGFLSRVGAAALGTAIRRDDWAQQSEPPLKHRLPDSDADYQRSRSYIEEVPIEQYHWAPDYAVEAFNDLKFGLSFCVRILPSAARTTSERRPF